jgi:hypothetical protein
MFYLPFFKSATKQKLFLGRKMLKGAFAHLVPLLYPKLYQCQWAVAVLDINLGYSFLINLSDTGKK